MTHEESEAYWRRVKEMVQIHPEVQRFLVINNKYFKACQRLEAAQRAERRLKQVWIEARAAMPEEARKALC